MVADLKEWLERCKLETGEGFFDGEAVRFVVGIIDGLFEEWSEREMLGIIEGFFEGILNSRSVDGKKGSVLEQTPKLPLVTSNITICKFHVL